MTPRFHSSALALAPLAASLLAGTASAQTAPTQAEVGQRVEKAAAWQQCTGMANNERLACFDDWAREQRELVSAIEERARSVQASPNAQASGVRAEVAAALASTQPESAPGTTPSGSAGIIGVGLEQGCRDRQFSELALLGAGIGLQLPHLQPARVPAQHGGDCRQQRSQPPAHLAQPDQQRHRIDRLQQAGHAPASVAAHQAGQRPADPQGRHAARFALGRLQPAVGVRQAFNSRLSRPFRNTDHMPELIYVYPTTLQLPGGWLWRYSGVGLAHQSNGQHPLSRSWNRAYVMAGFGKDNRFNVQMRLWKRLSESAEKDNNPDLTRYLGRGDVTVGWNIDSKNSLRATYTGFNKRGSGRIEWTHTLGDGWATASRPAAVHRAVPRLWRQPARLQLQAHGVFDWVEPADF